MDHVLDNPAWNALISGNKNISTGNENARFYPKDIGAFAGIPELSQSNFEALYDIVPADSVSIFIAPHDIEIPKPWEVITYLKVLQLVYEGSYNIAEHPEIIPLTEDHVPQMLELTKLTNPGPFLDRTIDFGYYQGIFEGDNLIAMAGQRMNPLPYAEISAVCTHPDHLGRGYASKLLLQQIKRIKAAGMIPFLHAKSDNERAIKVYEKLGFVARKEMSFYVIKEEVILRLS